MPGRLAYISSTGDRIELDARPTLSGTALGIRGRKWSYSLGWRSLTGISRDAREEQLDVTFRDKGVADRLRDLSDAAMMANAPGRLIIDGTWEQRAHLPAFDPTSISRGHLSGTLTVALLDGCWRRHKSVSIRPVGDAAGSNLDHPHDWPLDYGAQRPAATVFVDSPGPAPVRLTVYGPASQPAISIAGNRYEFATEVPAGGYLVADGASWPKAIKSVAANGDARDAFADGERGTGEGSGRYCFQPLPPGRSTVTVDGTFGVDIDWYEERGEPPWS